MTDIEKIIKGLECCKPYMYHGMHCEECPYKKKSLAERKECECVRELHKDIMILLKNQKIASNDEVDIIKEKDFNNGERRWVFTVGWCPRCRHRIDDVRVANFCYNCGQAFSLSQSFNGMELKKKIELL